MNPQTGEIFTYNVEADTETPLTSAFMQYATATPVSVTEASWICQFERDLTVQRTNEGLTAARARGRKGGRPPADKKAIEKALKLYDAQAMSIAEICEVCGISQGTLYKAKNERKNEKENENYGTEN